MSENVIQLDAQQWRVLLANTGSRISTFASTCEQITPEMLQELAKECDKAKAYGLAWLAAQQPQQIAPNGHAEPKRKGGWPKGKKRAAKEAVVQ